MCASGTEKEVSNWSSLTWCLNSILSTDFFFSMSYHNKDWPSPKTLYWGLYQCDSVCTRIASRDPFQSLSLNKHCQCHCLLFQASVLPKSLCISDFKWTLQMSFRLSYRPECWPSFHLVDGERQVVSLCVTPVACLKTRHHWLLDFTSTTQCKWAHGTGPEVTSGKSIHTDSALSPSSGIPTSYMNQNCICIYVIDHFNWAGVLNMWSHNCSNIIWGRAIRSKDDWTLHVLPLILHSTSRILEELKVLEELINPVRWVRKHVWENYQYLL